MKFIYSALAIFISLFVNLEAMSQSKVADQKKSVPSQATKPAIVPGEDAKQPTEPASSSSKISDKDLDDALTYLKKTSPDVHQKALDVWGKFGENSPNPHYTYLFWARSLVLWLKTNRKISFDSESMVGQVFKKLYDRKLISEHAAVRLTRDCWGYFVHLEGIPGWENKVLPIDPYPKNHVPKSRAPLGGSQASLKNI